MAFSGIFRPMEYSVFEPRLVAPILALTAGTSRREQDECVAAGMDDFIAKPVTPDTLLLKLAAHLNTTRETDTAAASATGEPASQVGDKYREALAALGGDRALFGDLAAILVVKWPVLIEECAGAYARHDWPSLARTLHTIKGSVSVFGSDGFTEQITEYLQRARAANPLPGGECIAFLETERERHRQLMVRNEKENGAAEQ